MKKSFLTTIAFLLGILTAFADNISVPGVSIVQGTTTTVGISLENTATNLVSFQMDLTLPEGITVNKADCSLSSRFTDEDQELTIGKQAANVYRLTSTSFALTSISGTSGEIITLSLLASANSIGGTATLSNIRFVSSNSERFTLDDASFTITVSAPSPAITFADDAVKTLCVANWDTNHDGELSEAEAAAVTDLGEVFKENTEIASFDELAYFTGLTSIGDNAFNGCNSLASVTFPNSLTSIGNNAFENCTGLTNVTIPNSVTNIGTNPFKKCSGLIAIVVEEGNVNYDSRNNCNAIIETATNKLVSGCKNTIIPEGITTIGGWAFSFCTDLTSMTIPDGVTDIQIAAFENCYALTSVAIPHGVTNIGGWAFSYCNNLPSVNIPNSVTSIGILAFNNCHSLTSIVIPNSVTYLGEAVFQDCNNLTTVNVDIDNPLAIDANTFSNRNNATLYVPFGCSEAYEVAEFWKDFNIVEMPAPLADIEENIYGLKNVETGKYLNAGNAWGTHAVLADEPLPARISKQSDGSYTIFFPVGSKSQQLLFRASTDGVYVDYQGQRDGCPYWTITDIGNGNYHIQSLTTHETYGQEALPGTYLGNDPDKEAIGRNGNALGVYNDVDGNVTEGKNITWTLEAVSARTDAQIAELQELVTVAQGLGLDTGEADAVLNNSEASYLDMLRAILELQQRINDKIEENNLISKRLQKRLQELTMLITYATVLGMNTDDAQAVADNPTSLDAVDIAIGTLRTAYISKLGEGVDASLLPLDVTGVIDNPSFALDNASGWEGSNPRFEEYNDAEFYQRTFDMYQTISGLPNGNYLLKVKGFHRPGSNQDVFSSYMNGENHASAQLYANSSNVILENQARYAQENQDMGGASVTIGEETYFVPNSMSDARNWFDAGYYENELPVTVTDGTLSIGTRLDESVPGGWVIFDDFRLELLQSADALHNQLTMSDITGIAGGVTNLPVSLENEDCIGDIQFNLHLPDGIDVNSVNGNLKVSYSDRLSGHTCDLSYKDSEGCYKVLIYGLGTSVTGNSGNIMTISLSLSNELGLGDCLLEISDIVLTKEDGTKIKPNDTQSTLTLVSAESGDANKDGDVDVADIRCIANYILGRPNNAFAEQAADANGDGEIDVADIRTIANRILHGNMSSTRRMLETQKEPQ